MRTERKRDRARRVAGTVVFACLAASTGWAGDLEPPGPPGPTMKTLLEVEPRTPISAASAPLTIDEPGSYYLTGDVHCTSLKVDCITITADHVTLDLMGFTVRGGRNAIWAQGVAGASVRNGRVTESAESGVYLSSTGSRVVAVDAIGNGDFGILIGNDSLIHDSSARENGGTGIYVGYRSIVSTCRSSSNDSDGFRVNWDSKVLGSVAVDNGRHGFNTSGSHIEGCAARRNEFSGFQLESAALVIANVAYNNGMTANYGAGFEIRGGGSRVEGNHADGNWIGFWDRGYGNVIVRNSAGGNHDNYNFSSPGPTGPISDVDSATNPWANIEY